MRVRLFFHRAVRFDIEKCRERKDRTIAEMENLVSAAYDRLKSKQEKIQEQSTRDANAEIIETKRRKMYQLKKSDAVTKFENVLCSAVQGNLKKAVIKTLREVKEPVFNKELSMEKIGELASYWVDMKLEE